ncbi:hypothetical protein HUX88_19275 [Duganella sp. BJB1802]|uniref:hypothetical protein n=1 Tax=Duganella sp. BJB1802 TaxID=2744575 RepID=UPI001593A716|nr:hypothetical protein [Duganella sp. BJB1802]NVD72665.1 hypothetical protein [Duganella sp. BJB1802]
MNKRLRRVAAVLAMASMAQAGAAGKAPLRQSHPVIGTWQITIPDGSCSETYRIRADGTTLVFSNEEVAESTFAISDRPDKEGFYKEVDTIVKDNGKRDCLGEVTKVGRAVTSYLLFHPSGDMFLMCVERRTDKCIGPFIRIKGESI